MHSVAGISYLYLLLTGLAFWTPALYWLAVVLGGGYLSRLLHPWVGLVFVGGGGVDVRPLAPRHARSPPRTGCGARRSAAYVRNDDAGVPPAGRFNYGQKMLFWLMAWGGVALLVSGVVMWFVASVPWELRGLREVATLVHAVAALRDDRRLHRSRLHGRGGRARRAARRDSRQRHRGVGEAPSSSVAGRPAFAIGWPHRVGLIGGRGTPSVA